MDITHLSEGQWLSRTSYIRIERNTTRGFTVSNTSGLEWHITPEIIPSECESADQWTTEKLITRTEMARLLHGAGASIFKVRFNKTNGEERILIGHLIHGEELMGRAQVIDLSIARGTYNQRQVDYRSLNELVLSGTHYTVKGETPKFINGSSTLASPSTCNDTSQRPHKRRRAS